MVKKWIPHLIYPGTIALCGILTLLVATRLGSGPSDALLLYQSTWEFIMLGSFVLGFLFRRSWELAFSAAALAGVWYLPGLALPLSTAIVVSSLLTLVAALYKPASKLFAVVGAVGIGFAVARWMPIEALITGLAVLTLYDMVAGASAGDKASMNRAEVVIPLALVVRVIPLGFYMGVVTVLGIILGAAAATLRPSAQGPRTEFVCLGAVVPAVCFLLYRVFL